jgi:hypothetical protein
MKITDFLIAMFTLALVIVGTWQGVQLQRTVEATKSAADALPKIERAYVFPDLIVGDAKGTTATREDGVVVTRRNVLITISIKNHGRTPAVLGDFTAGIGLCKNLSQRRMIEQQRLTAPGRVLGSGEPFAAKDRIFNVDDEGVKDIERGRADDSMLVLFGKVEYLDVLGKMQTTEFCRIWHPPTEWAMATEGNSWT